MSWLTLYMNVNILYKRSIDVLIIPIMSGSLTAIVAYWQNVNNKSIHRTFYNDIWYFVFGFYRDVKYE